MHESSFFRDSCIIDIAVRAFFLCVICNFSCVTLHSVFSVVSGTQCLMFRIHMLMLYSSFQVLYDLFYQSWYGIRLRRSVLMGCSLISSIFTLTNEMTAIMWLSCLWKIPCMQFGNIFICIWLRCPMDMWLFQPNKPLNIVTIWSCNLQSSCWEIPLRERISISS